MSVCFSDRELELLLAIMESDSKLASDWLTLLICYKREKMEEWNYNKYDNKEGEQ